MPGETVDAALDAAGRFAAAKLPTTFTYLGENVTSEAEAAQVTEHYLGVLDRVAERGLDTEISVKLTHLGFDLGLDRASANLERLIRRAQEHGNRVWIDMEASHYVEGTLDVYRRALDVSPDLGLCLQAYLHRTAKDLDALLPLRPSIRLVKGAYREPSDVAIQSKPAVDGNFLALIRTMLGAVGEGRFGRLAVATHDLTLIRRVDAAAAALGLGRDAHEVQMLYGIRQVEQFRLAASGRRTRSLIAYGPAWYPWYVRRLAERPANILFVARNLFVRMPAGAHPAEDVRGS
jgi:proline dehydrogenase